MASASSRLCLPLSLIPLKTHRVNLAEPKEAALEPTSLALVVCVTSPPAGQTGSRDDPPGQSPWAVDWLLHNCLGSCPADLPFYHQMTLCFNAEVHRVVFLASGT